MIDIEKCELVLVGRERCWHHPGKKLSKYDVMHDGVQIGRVEQEEVMHTLSRMSSGVRLRDTYPIKWIWDSWQEHRHKPSYPIRECDTRKEALEKLVRYRNSFEDA